MNGVAQTILQQLGGNKFIVMTGAKNFIAGNNNIHFSIPGHGFAKAGINTIQIILDPSDTYTIKFYRFWGTKITLICEFNDIYADNLQEVFTRETGLETHL